MILARNQRMELFFTDINFEINKSVNKNIPFLVDKDMRLVKDVNDYLFYIAVINGHTESEETWETYGRNLCDFFSWLEMQNLDWREIRRVHIGAYIQAMINTPSAHTGRPVKESTINQRSGSVLRFYEFMRKKNKIDNLPFTKEDINLRNTGGLLAHTGKRSISTSDVLIKTHKILPKYLPLKLAADFINKGLINERAKLMAQLMLQSGMRRAEVTLLPLSVIIEAEKSLKFNSDSNIVRLDLPAQICKGKKPRSVFISKILLGKIRQYRAFVRPTHEKLFSKKQKGKEFKSERLWLSELGDELSVTCLNRDFKQAESRVGFKCTPHMMRHTFATHHYLLRRDIRELQKLLGHSSIITTQIYEHSTPYDNKLGFIDDLQNDIDELFMKGA